MLSNSIIVFLAQAVPEGRVFGLDMQTFISAAIQLLNAIILALVLTKILYKPVKEFMQKRSDKIKSKMDNADATMAKAQELIAEYDEKIRKIDKERAEILESARLQAEEEYKKILEEAKQEAREIKKRSMESAAEEKKRLKEETRLYIVEIASLMAYKFIQQNIDEKMQEKLFEEAMARLEDSQWQS